MVEPRKSLRAGIYARQSHGNKRSIAEQINDCTRDAQAQGWTVAGVYEDTTTASRYARKARPGHAKLLEHLGAGLIEAVVLWEPSRGDRTLASWASFLELCRTKHVLVRVTDHHNTYDVTRPRDWRSLAEDGVDSTYESDKTRQRILRTMQANLDNGKSVGIAPYGYVRRYHPVTRELIAQEPHPEQALVVAEIVDRVADGHTLAGITADLNARSVPPPSSNRPVARGDTWYYNAVRRIVANEAYLGTLKHNGTGQRYDGGWPPIVDPARFHAANRVLEARKGQGWRSTRAEHLLTGIPVADKCGHPMAGRLERGTRYRRYACRPDGCTYADADALEELVLAYVLGRLARRDVYSTLRQAGADADMERAAALDVVANLSARLEMWRESAVAGETTPATMAKVERDLSMQIGQARARAERAGVPPGVRTLADAGEDLPARWAQMPLAARRDVVAALVDIRVAPGCKGVRTSVQDRVRVQWKGTS